MNDEVIQRYDLEVSEYGTGIGPKSDGTYVRYADIEPLEQKCEAYRSLWMEMALFCARLDGWEVVDERCLKSALDLLSR